MVTQASGRTIKADADNDIVFDGLIYAKGFSWSGLDKEIGDELLLENTSGDEIWHAVYDGGPNEILFDSCMPFDGIKVARISNGSVLTYVG